MDGTGIIQKETRKSDTLHCWAMSYARVVANSPKILHLMIKDDLPRIMIYDLLEQILSDNDILDTHYTKYST